MFNLVKSILEKDPSQLPSIKDILEGSNDLHEWRFKSQEELELDDEEEEDQNENKLEELVEISPEDFQAAWSSDEVHVVELDISSFVTANVGQAKYGDFKVFVNCYI